MKLRQAALALALSAAAMPAAAQVVIQRFDKVVVGPAVPTALPIPPSISASDQTVGIYEFATVLNTYGWWRMTSPLWTLWEVVSNAQDNSGIATLFLNTKAIGGGVVSEQNCYGSTASGNSDATTGPACIYAISGSATNGFNFILQAGVPLNFYFGGENVANKKWQWAATTGDLVASSNAAFTSMRGASVTFANRPATPVEGMLVAFTDSTTNVWGATITGTGANHVLGYYDGTNWTVAGK